MTARPPTFRSGSPTGSHPGAGASPDADLDAGPDKPNIRVGIDTGGTFTDLYAVLPGGATQTHKVRSTPEDPGHAIALGLQEMGLLKKGDFEADSAGGAALEIVHGTTVALNAMLTGRLGDAALVTNAGFRDLTEIDRQARPDLYALEPVRPTPLVPRERRFEIGQRSAVLDGRVVEELRPTDGDIANLCDEVQASGATSVAVCLLHSYGDAEPERRIAEALRKRGLSATASADLVPEYREAERFSTALANAALIPVVREYLASLAQRLSGAQLELLQSSGGGLAAGRAADEPVRVLLSGPAGGVVGAADAARAAFGDDRAIATLDMGGTSTDVAFHDPALGLGTLGEEVRVAEHSIAVPTLDMHTIGCGGGSLARVDATGILRVGPESAGADPGPIAFGRGGTEVTVTDAYVQLGHIPREPIQQGFLGGTLSLDTDGVARAFERLGEQLSLSPSGAAEAVLESAVAAMRRALGVMTMQRGRDPRKTPLVAFGGGGGLCAAALVRALEMPSALVPPASGVLSAVGMARAARTADRSRTVLRAAHDVTARELDGWLEQLARDCRQTLGVAEDADCTSEVGLAMRYSGQSYELNIPGHTNDPVAAFHAAHEERFGWNLPDHEVQLVHARARVTAPAPMRTEERVAQDSGVAVTPLTHQTATFDDDEWDTPIVARSSLGLNTVLEGPTIVVEPTGTTIVRPGFTARVVPSGGILLQRIP